MGLEEDFIKASEEVKSLPKRPSDADLLELYALFKQASDGDVAGSRPGMLDFKGRAKYDAWAKFKGMDAETAKKTYVETVSKLASQ